MAGTRADVETGLSAAEVEERIAQGRTNSVEQRTSRTIGEIIRANVLTRFNAILAVLAVCVLATGRFGDALFAVVLVLNSLIGIGQELRAKRTLDRLALLNAPTTHVVRDGEVCQVRIAEVVADDVVELRAGDQVPADGTLVTSAGLEIDESSLTGESDPVPKEEGSEVLSGTVVLAGSGRLTAEAVGADSYVNRLADEVKQFNPARSELQDGINTLLRYITWLIVATTPLLLWSQYNSYDGDDWRDPVTSSVAALVGMIPEGLVLLTSLSFLLAALDLTRRRVLVQELPAVEGLARVDVVCLDKTGTLTWGDIVFDHLEVLTDDTPVDPEAALGALAGASTRNASMGAISEACPAPEPAWPVEDEIPFSSARKWSAARFAQHGSIIMGAPDMLLSDDDPLRDRVGELASTGRRVMLLQHSNEPLPDAALPDGRRSVALVVLAESVRQDAGETLAFFADQGVGIKIISGDNPSTVAAIAREVGIDPGEPIDARYLGDSPEEVSEAVAANTVFGRVSPQQKRAMVRALQAQGHTVAMTGDGVNDAMALKDADIGVAMGNAAQATKAASQLVLLDGEFSRMPRVLAEGRRVIGNIERVASLFLSKNTYSFLLVLLVSIAGLPYPFLPRHLTLISAVTIGIPGFFLALGPNRARYRPGFLRRVLTFSVPAGSAVGLSVFGAYAMATATNTTGDQARTAATIAALVVALWILAVLARPFRWWKAALVGSMAGIATAALVIEPVRELFNLDTSPSVITYGLTVGAAGAMAVELVARFTVLKDHAAVVTDDDDVAQG